MQIETNRHLDEEEIEKYSLGEVTEEESSRFEEHLLICGSCQDRVTESDNYVAAMQGAAARIRREGPGTRRRRWLVHRFTPTLAVAASALLLAAGGLWWVRGPSNGNRVAEPAFAISLAATRGNGIEAKAPPGRALTLQLDLAGLPPASFRLEMVDAVGKRVWQGAAVSQDSKAVASVPQMASGLYFVRAYATSGTLLREYGLEVEGR